MDPKPPISAQSSQVVVSLTIVAALTIVAIGLVIASLVTKDWSFSGGAIGAIVGAMATALNTPSGVTAALAESKKPAPAPVDPAP